MAELSARKRATLPNSAFAYIDAQGRRRLPINDEAHVRNALARFGRVLFDDDTAREQARRKLLRAAKKFGIVPIGFVDGELRTQSRAVDAGRLVVELQRTGGPLHLEESLRTVLRDPTLVILQWSESTDGYLDGDGQPVELPGDGAGRIVTLLERRGRPMAALVHDPAVLNEPDLVKTVSAALRLAIENERLQGEVEARTSEVHRLPTGFVTFLLTDIEGSTGLLDHLGDRYAALLAEVRSIHRVATRRAGGFEIDARADEFFAAFPRAAAALEAALAINRRLRDRAWPDNLKVRIRAGIHRGRPTLTDTGYVGLAVHTVARLCAVGHGGQILVSRAAHDAIDGDGPAGVGFHSLGRVQLRGLPETDELFQVTGPDLPQRFPPLRSAQPATSPA